MKNIVLTVCAFFLTTTLTPAFSNNSGQEAPTEMTL